MMRGEERGGEERRGVDDERRGGRGRERNRDRERERERERVR